MLSLLQLKQHLQIHKRVSVAGLSQVFQEEPPVIEGMLSYFIQKGCVRRCEISDRKTRCSGCPLHCSNQASAIFEWI